MIEKIHPHLPSRHTVAVLLASLAALAVALAAFARSFSALSHLAVMHGWPDGQAWILPIALDGMIVVPTIGAVVAVRRDSRMYAWSLLIAGTALSVAGNGIYAWITTGSKIAVGLAIIPPIITLAAVHLAIVIARRDADDATEPIRGQTTSLTERATPQDPAPVTALRSVAAPPAGPVAAAELPESVLIDKALRLVAEGKSRRAVAAELGVSKDRVQRWVTGQTTARRRETVAV